MRIYRVTCEMDFYCDGEKYDPQEEGVDVAAETMERASAKARLYIAKQHHGLKPYRESVTEDGKKVTYTYQYKDISTKSCELIAESDI
jgi:hypothetical protein